MSSDPSHNPFAGDHSGIQKREAAARWGLRMGSYLVVLTTVAIMLHVFMKGAPVTFQSEWPFVNTQFLTELPATLHVIDDKQGNHYETDVHGADAIKKQLGDNFRSEKTISYSGGRHPGADCRHGAAGDRQRQRGPVSGCLLRHLLERVCAQREVSGDGAPGPS